MSFVLDASAVLAIVFDENGADKASAHARSSLVSAINMVEVLEKVQARKLPPGDVISLLKRLEVEIVPFDEHQALVSAGLRPAARKLGISLADVACLSLAATRALAAVTADREWRKLDDDIEIILIR